MSSSDATSPVPLPNTAELAPESTPTQEGEAPAGDMPPAAAATLSSDSDPAAPVQQSGTNPDDETPTSDEPKADDQSEPVIPEMPKSEDEPKPVIPDMAQAEDEPKPVMPEMAQAEDEPKPVVPEMPKDEDELAPVVPEMPKDEDELAPVVPEMPKSEDEPNPVTSEQPKSEDQSTPVTPQEPIVESHPGAAVISPVEQPAPTPEAAAPPPPTAAAVSSDLPVADPPTEQDGPAPPAAPSPDEAQAPPTPPQTTPSLPEAAHPPAVVPVETPLAPAPLAEPAVAAEPPPAPVTAPTPEPATDAGTAEQPAEAAKEENVPPPPPPPLYESPPEPEEPASLTAAVKEAEERLMGLAFTWQQTEKAVNIRVDLPPNVMARSLSVSIKGDRLGVSITGKPLLEWRLFDSVVVAVDEAQWTIETVKDGTRVLDFDLPKAEEGRWQYLIKQRLPAQYLLPATEVQSFIDAEKPSEPPADAPPGLVLGADGIKLNPEVETLTDADRPLTAAQLYQNGITCFRQGSTSFAEGLRLLRLCALHHDHADACLFLFEVYAGDTNYGLDKNFQAGLWFLRYGADRTNDLRIFVTLANQYEHGLSGLPLSFGHTVKYFQRAAKEGHATAMSHLADILMQGRCIDLQEEPVESRKRPVLAKELLMHAQKRGCPQAFVTIGDCYLKDMPGFPRDLAKAEAAYDRARELFPEIRAVIPTHELALMKKAMEEARAPPRAEDDIPEISTPGALAQAKPRPPNKGLQDRLRRMEGQLTKTTANDTAPPEATSRLWGGPAFWEKVGTTAVVVAMGAWLLYVSTAAPTRR